MLDKNGIIRRMALADANAQRELNQWKGPGRPDPSMFAESIYRYVLYKFLLDDEEALPVTHELNALAAYSVEKAGRLNPNEAALLDVSKHCGATSSFMTKKVLLFMSLSKYFGFAYPPYNTADIETTDELARIILEKTGMGPCGSVGKKGESYDPGAFERDPEGTERI